MRYRDGDELVKKEKERKKVKGADKEKKLFRHGTKQGLHGLGLAIISLMRHGL
jgi:hypothetical protein